MTEPIPLLRGSERKDFKRCQARWWWAWRDGLESNRQKTPLWFGTGIHLAMEQWYIPGTKRGRDLRETWSEYCEGVSELIRVEVLSGSLHRDYEQVVMDAEGVGLAMLDNYLVEYGNDDEWEILSPEQTFAVRIPREVGVDRTPVAKFLGTFDITARHRGTGKVWLWDHKTAKSIKTNHLPLDDQAGGYWAVADTTLRRQGVIGGKERISGILYNFLMKAPPDDRPVDEKGRATNKPKKEHYIAALMEYRAAEATKAGVQEEWLNVTGPETHKELTKMKVSDLIEEAYEVDLTVLGDISLQQPSPRFHRENVYRTAKERRKQIQHISDEVQHMNMVRKGLLPVTKNPTRDCTWDCDFYDLCTTEEQGGDVEMFKEAAFHVRDPYAAHREKPGEF